MSEPRPTSHAKLHITLALGLALCTVAFVVEIRRALAGHYLAWVYVFEWPIFAIFGTWVWWRLVSKSDDDASEPVRPPKPPTKSDVAADDPDLVAWNEYVERFTKDNEGRPDEPERPSSQ